MTASGARESQKGAASGLVDVHRSAGTLCALACTVGRVRAGGCAHPLNGSDESSGLVVPCASGSPMTLALSVALAARAGDALPQGQWRVVPDNASVLSDDVPYWRQCKLRCTVNLVPRLPEAE